jgi:hypothetical protein
MGIRVTDGMQVALFDSVTGFAFGIVFDDVADADDFLEWVEEQDLSDPRDWTDAQFEQEYNNWQDERYGEVEF